MGDYMYRQKLLFTILSFGLDRSMLTIAVILVVCNRSSDISNLAVVV